MSKQIARGLLQKFQVTVLSPILRSVGKGLYYLGREVQGTNSSVDRLLPCPNSISISGQKPNLEHLVFLGANTSLTGNVTVGKNSSIFFASNLRTDGSLSSAIKIGSDTIINDLVTMKAERNGSVIIGNNCFIGSNSFIVNSDIENNVFIGIGASIAENCKLEKHSVLAAGAKLESGSIVKSNEMWAGSPAKFLRNITQEEVEYLDDLRTQNIKLANIYYEETSDIYKDFTNDIKIFEADGFEGQNVNKVMFDWVAISEKHKFPVEENDFRHNPNRKLANKSFAENRFEEQPLNYDGEKNLLPNHFNASKDNFHKKNLIKNKLENDPDTQRMKREYFDQENINLNDEQFKRRY